MKNQSRRKSNSELNLDADTQGRQWGRCVQLGPSFIYRIKEDQARIRYAFCLCDCGKVFRAIYGNLKSGQTSQCRDCTRKKAAPRKYHKTHALSRTPTYRVYVNMKWRAKRLTNYMRRGITDRWLGKGGFERFLKDMGERPGDDYDLDRIDNSRGYNKRNCHWILRSEHRKKSAIESKLRRLSEVLEELFDLTS